MPEEWLRVWQRSAVHFCAEISRGAVCQKPDDASGSSGADAVESNTTLDQRLKALMLFLRSEVESEQRILLASEGFGLHSTTKIVGKPENSLAKKSPGTKNATGADLQQDKY